MMGVTLTDTQHGRYARKQANPVSFSEVCTELVERMRGRFDIENNVIQATRIVNLKDWPEDNQSTGDCKILIRFIYSQILLANFL